MAVKVRYGMVGGHMSAFIGEVHRKAIAFDPRAQFHQPDADNAAAYAPYYELYKALYPALKESYHGVFRIPG